MINSIHRLKDYVSDELRIRNSSEMIIYNVKGLQIDDSDISFLREEEVLCVSSDGSGFDCTNYIHMFEFGKNVKSGSYGKVYIAVNIFTGEKVAVKKIDTETLCKFKLILSFRRNL